MPRGFIGTAGQEQLKMISKKFGRLLVLHYDKETSKLKGCDYYLCQCDCDTKKIIQGNYLRIGHTKSCGCLQREVSKRRIRKFDKTHDRTGKNNSNYSTGFCVESKRFCETIRVRDKVCQICDKMKEDNGRKLSAHHLDGNHYNNDPKNGVLLCNSCHAIVTCNGNVWRPNRVTIS